MLDNESNSFLNDKKNYEHQCKELLYNLFYEIKSEILGKKIEIDEDEYQENVTRITIPKLINYIHDSIQILITTKIEISKRKQKVEDDKYYTKLSSNMQIQNDQEEKIKYENIIRKLEEKERILYKNNFHHTLQKEAMENKISELMEVEDKFEEMKEKLKYEDGRFLNNDRKDNEILIIRRENSNLKNTIKDLENKIKNLNDFNEQLKTKIKQLNGQINDLRIKIEEKQAKFNLSSNYFQNINNNISTNNSNNNTKGLINLEENAFEGNDQYSSKMKKNYVKLTTGKDKENKHNNTVKYYRNKNMNLYKNQFNKVKPKIFSHKKKHEENNTYNDKKSTKNSTNNDIICSTRNEYTERLNYKFFSGNNVIKNNNIVPKHHSSNKKNYRFPMNNSQVVCGKYSILFNNKKNNKIINKINNIYSIKKILAYGSAKCSRPNSTKKIIKKNSRSSKRSSSGE